MSDANNAGIKRNRRPAGLPVVERKIRLAAETDHALKAACEQSGGLSRSLYLERLLAQLAGDHGALPVLQPTLLPAEVTSSDAA